MAVFRTLLLGILAMSVIIINEAFFDSFIRNDATFPLFLTPLPYGLRFAFWFPQLREHILQMSNSVRLHARGGGGGYSHIWAI